MKMDRTRWLALAVFCLAGLAQAAPAGAQPAALPDTLAAALSAAWQRHPQAAGLDWRKAEADAAGELAGALTPQPASLSLENFNDRQGRNRGQQEWELELAVPLWLPGQQAAQRAVADGRIAEAHTQALAARLAVAGEVRATWWALAGARSTLAMATRRRTTAQALASDVERRYAAGELSRLDVNAAQGETLAAEVELLDAQVALRRAEQDFRLLTGSEAPPTLAEELPAPAQDTADDGDALTLHPQLGAAAAQVRSAQARLKLSAAKRRETPELALRVVRARDEFNAPVDHSVGIKLTVPFGSGAQVRHDTSAAQAEVEQADAQMQLAKRRLHADIARAGEALAAAQRQLLMARERRALLDDNLRLAEKSFALGEADLATLLRARAAAYEAESFHERQRLARAAAISQLNQNLGVLP